MSIVSDLLGEHGVLCALLDRLEELAPHANLPELRALRDLAAECIQTHAQVEDDLLFGPLERTSSRAEAAVRGMRTMHQDIDHLLEELVPMEHEARVREQLLNLATLTSMHFLAEEEAIFPLAEEALPGEVLEELGRQYLERRALMGISIHV